MILDALGKLPSAARIAELSQSPQWHGSAFANVEPTDVLRKGASYVGLIRQALSRPKDTSPPGVLPSIRLDLSQLRDAIPQVVWFGHSSYLISHNGYRVLVDPVLFGNSSPVGFFGKPFPVTNAYAAGDIPPVDLLVITHDHYDHLDMVTLRMLRSRIRRIVCPLGVSAHLRYWGFDSAIITEVDWHERVQIASDIALTSLPARHFSGRVFKRGQSLWSSYALELRGYRIFLGGDSGYDRQFSLIGQQHGPFDFALLECGQYGRDWPDIHMFPEQTAIAAREVRTKQLMPVHWGKFVLANHSWNEPIRRLMIAAAGADYGVVTPCIGDAIAVGEPAVRNDWWESVSK